MKRCLSVLLLVAFILGAAAPVEAAPARDVTYVVRQGDTLRSIALKFGVSVQAIMQVNGISNPNLIYVGQRLVIPTGGSDTSNSGGGTSSSGVCGKNYTVQRGETLGIIAAKCLTTVSAMMSANSITNGNLIYVGQVLTMPGATSGDSTNAAVATSAPPPANTGGVNRCGATYTVQRGDTLRTIASKCGTTIAALTALNTIHNLNLIYAGQRLAMPNAPVTAATVAPAAAVTASPTSAPPPASVSVASVVGAAPTLRESSISILTYPWKDSPVPTSQGDPIYPYPRLGYDPATFTPTSPVNQSYKTVVLENDYVRLTFLPELGGRLYRWEDKVTGRNMLYNNPVIRPTGWGYRKWWLPVGGLEWSLPVEDHGLVEWRPWGYTTATGQNTAAVILFTTDDRTGLQASIRIELDSSHSYFTLTPTLTNPTTGTLPFQFWMTALAAPAGDNRAGADLRFDLPVNAMLVHSTDDKSLPVGQTISWPVTAGRDMSVYGSWNEFLSLFASPSASQPYAGLYSPRADQGFVRSFPPDVARGLKLFAPGNLPAWVWTSDDSNYVELWGGLTTNFSENATLPPGSSFSWSERWYPFHGIGNFVWANNDVAFSLNETSDSVTVGLYTTSAQSLQVVLFVGGLEVQRWPITTASPSAWTGTWARTVAGSPGVQVLDSSGSVVGRVGSAP